MTTDNTEGLVERLRALASNPDHDDAARRLADEAATALSRQQAGAAEPVAWPFDQIKPIPNAAPSAPQAPGPTIADHAAFLAGGSYAVPQAEAGDGVVPDLGAAVNRFLSWRVPEDFYPDCYVTFDKDKALATNQWPIGTNLLTATQARAMLAHVLYYKEKT